MEEKKRGREIARVEIKLPYEEFKVGCDLLEVGHIALQPSPPTSDLSEIMSTKVGVGNAIFFLFPKKNLEFQISGFF